MKRKSERFLLRLFTGFLSPAMILFSHPAYALRISQLESPARRAGLEEALRSEEELLELEIALADQIKGEAGYSRKIRVEGHVNEESVRSATDHVRERTMVVLTLARQYPEGDILTATPEELKLAGKVGAWLGPAGTLFVADRIWREAPLELLQQAFTEKNFDLLGAKPSVAPPPPALEPAPTPPPAAPEPAPAAPAPGPPAAPTVEAAPPKPAPAPLPVKTPAAATTVAEIWRQIADTAQAASRGRLIPNVGVIQVEPDLTGFALWLDASASTRRGLTFATLNGAPIPMPLAPDPRSVPKKLIQSAARYQVKLGDAEITAAVTQKHQNFRLFAERVRRAGLGVLLPDPKRRWVTGTLQELRQILARGGEALEAGRKVKPTQVEAVLQRVRDLERHHRDLARRVADGMRRLRSEAQEGRVPTGSVMEVLQSLAEVLAPWPRIQQEVEQSVLGIQESDNPWEELKDHDDFIQRVVPRVAREGDREALFGAASSDVLAAVYYDAFRAVWLEGIAEMEEQAADAQGTALDDLAEELLQLATWVMGFERDAVISETAAERAMPISQEQLSPAHPLPAVGVLLLDPQGKVRRFIPGGGAVMHLGALSTRFSPHRIADWYQPGDRIVLVYSSITGLPNVEQMKFFTEDRFVLENALPGRPEVWAATATAAGSVRLFRPQAQPGDPAEWNQLYEQVVERYSPYTKYDATLSQEVRQPTMKHSMDELASEAQSQVERIAKATGRVLPKGAGVRKLTQHLNPKVAWAQGLLAGFPRLIQESLRNPYGGQRAEELAADVGRWYSAELASLRVEKRTDALVNGSVVLIQRANAYVVERLGESLIGEAGPFVPVQIEGLTDPDPPQVKPPAGLGPEPGAAGSPAEQGAEPAGEPTLEDRVAQALKELLAQAGKHPGDFPAQQMEEIRSYAGTWVRERLEADQKPRFVDFKKAWHERQTRGDAFAGQVREAVQKAEKLLGQVAGLSTPRVVVRQMEEMEPELYTLAGKLARYPNLTAPLDAVKQRLQTAQALVEELRQMHAVLPGDTIQVRALLDSSRAMAASLGAEGQEGKWKETLARGRAELVGRVIGPAEKSAEALLKSVWGSKEIEQAGRLLETLSRLAELVRADGSFEADATRLDEYPTQIQAAIEKAERDLERIAADQAKVENEQLLRESASLPKVAEILRTDHRFSQFILTGKDADREMDLFTRKVADREPFGQLTGLAHAVKTRMEVELQQKMGNYKRQAFEALLRIAEAILEPRGHHAGLEEALVDPRRVARRLQARAARERRNVVVFLQPELFAEADLRALDDLALVGLGVEIRQALATAGQGTGDLQMVLASGRDLPRLQELYRGWRIVQIRRQPGSDERPLPVSAVPVVVARALASGRPLFEVVVTPYLNLGERTLPQVLQELSARVAA